MTLLFCSIYCFYLLFARGVQQSTLQLPFSPGRIVVLHGILIEDSTLCRTGDQLLRVTLKRAATKRGYSGSASGVVAVLAPVQEVLIASSGVRVVGTWDEQGGCFYASDFHVEQLPQIAYYRRKVLASLQRRLEASVEDSQARSLASMLLLGQLSGDSFPLKDKAIACGCAHTLALSGMHLHFFLQISLVLCRGLFGIFWGKRIACITPLLYILVVGPKPSLVRSLGMYLFALIPFSSYFCLVAPFYLTACMQLWLFPSSVTSFAFLFSYGAFAMLLFGSDLPPIPLKGTSLAVLGTGPASLYLTGNWTFFGLLFSLPATLLIHLAMVFSILVICFGSFFSRLLQWVSMMLDGLFSLSSEDAMEFSAGSYLLYALLLLTTLFAIGYAKRVFQRRRRSSYALELSLRFPSCDQRPVTERGAGNDQEVWTELPDIESSP
ncbi:MAG: ComEC/Rec2 family competence protein [Sphaerochaeta sp.]